MPQSFWRRWLTIGAAYGVAVGTWIVAFSLLPESAGLDPFLRWTFALHPGGLGPLTPAVRLATAVTGALTVGLSVVAWGLRPDAASAPGEARRAGRALAAGMVAWFVLDSAASLALGGALNVVGNATFLIALVPPSVALARGAR